MWSKSFSNEHVFHVDSRFLSTLSRDIYAVARVMKISVASSPSGEDFLHRDCFFSTLKQFVRTCSQIVKTYFETILVFEKKFFANFSRFRITIDIHTPLSYWGYHRNPYHTHISSYFSSWEYSKIMIPHEEMIP